MKKIFTLLLLLITFSCSSIIGACTLKSIDDSSVIDSAFESTAPDSSFADSSSAEDIPSSDASFTVTHVFQREVQGRTVYLSEAQFNQIMQAEDLSELITATIADKATLEIELDKTQAVLGFTCTAEDKIEQQSTTISLKIMEAFGTHSIQGVGLASNGAWSDEHAGYYVNGAVCALDDNGANLTDYYSYNFNATLTGLSKGSELVMSSYQTESVTIRFVLRGEDESHYLLFTDYRDNSGYINYLELKTNVAYVEGEKINFEIINAGNSMVMKHNGETLFRRRLATINHSELVLNRVTHAFIVNDIVSNTNKDSVITAHDNALNGFDEIFFGDNTLGYGFLTEQAVKNEDGSIYIPGATSNERVMGAYYHEGVPVGGHEFAVSVDVRMQNTKEGGGTASKSEFQLYKDAKNSIKFHMFRYPSNNTLMAYEQKSGIQTDITINKNQFPTGTDYTYNLLILYKNGKVELWIQDNFSNNSSSLYENRTLVYENRFDWNYSGFSFAMRQYTDTNWANWQVYYNQDFDTLYTQLHGESVESNVTFSSSNTTYTESSIFTQNSNGEFVKQSFDYGKAFIAKDQEIVYGNKWMISALVNFESYKQWGQGEFQFYQDDINAVRYVFEFQGTDFQVFTEKKVQSALWQNWKIIRRPSSSTPAYLNMTVVNDNGNLYLLINGKVWHEYTNTSFSDLYATFGGQNASVKVSDITIETNSSAVDNFVANMEYYVYESSYESRIRELEAEYADAEKGGIVLAGSSSVDFWNTWQEDLGADVLAYNVGIGGTTTYDWQVAYPRLIKPLNPSQILLFLGGNDVNGLGETGADTALRLQAMLELMHADFPNTNIVYVLSMPVPNNYNNGKFTTEYGKLVNAMKVYGQQNASWLKTVDLESHLTSNNQPIPEYFKSDNIHLTEAGYAVWTSQIKPLLVHENTVLRDTSYNVVNGSWSITKDDEENKVYTSTGDDAMLVFTEITLENNAVVEFDMTLLANGSSIVGAVFGLDSITSNDGFCIGRANTSKPGSAWIINGTPGGFASGDDTFVNISYEQGKTYKIKVECNISAGTYDMYIDGVFARHLYFKTSSTAGKENLYTGAYFGLYGGKSGGRTQFSNIKIGVKEVEPEPEPEKTNYNILAGSWDITEDENGVKTYTSTADKAYLVFKDIQLGNNAIIEFDLTVLQSSSYTAGVLFGLASDTATDGLCIGRAASTNPGSGWIENGVQGTTGGGGSTKVKLENENQVYHIKIVCDIAAGTYDMYIDGVFARNLYFKVNTTNNKTSDDVLHTGAYFGLYGGENGRTRFSNITISYEE